MKNGKLNVEVEGLLIAAGQLANGTPVPANLVGTTGTVMFVAASLVCGGMVVDSTPAFALSAAGNAEMEGRVNAPASCAAPGGAGANSPLHLGDKSGTQGLHRAQRFVAQQ